MKKQTSVFILSLILSSTTLMAQTKSPDKKGLTDNVVIVNAQLDVFKTNVHGQLQITELQSDQYDRISVSDNQGKVLIQKNVNTSVADMDLSQLNDGVYLLGLRSSVNMKEKTIKFIINR